MWTGLEMDRKRRRNLGKLFPSGDFHKATPCLLIVRRLSGDWRLVDRAAPYIRQDDRRGHFGAFAAILQFAPIWYAAFHKIYMFVGIPA